MRNGQNNKRMRNRNRKGQNPMTRVFESNGPEVKIRGTASHVAEKYVQLARDAQGSGDPVGAENYYQHAEHYFRMIAAAQEQFRQTQPFYRNDGETRDESGDDGDGDGDDGFQPFGAEPGFGPQHQPYPPRDAQPFQPREQQHREHNNQPHRAPQPQPQVNPVGPEGGNIERLPSFITGNQPQAEQNGGYDRNNGQERNERNERNDRYSHRRRRRHHGPRSDGPNQAAGDDFKQNTTD